MSPPTPQDEIQNLLFDAAEAASDSAAIKTMLHGVLVGMIKIHDRIDVMDARLDSINKAFPDGPENHCRAHEALIERNNLLRKLTYAVAEKSLGLLFWAGLSWIGIALWVAFKGSVK